MAPRRKFRRRTRRRRSKLADKKINTLVEKRMLQIAKKEDRKNIYRNSVVAPYGDYFTSGQCKHWNQITSEPSAFKICAGFAATSVTVPALKIPLAANIAIGGISYSKMPAGQRRTNKVYVTGFKMTGMFRIKRSSTRSSGDWVRISLYESILNNNAFPSGSALDTVMTLDHVPPATGFVLDETDEDAIQRRKQQKCLHKKVFKLHTNGAGGNELVHLPFTFQKFFKTPKMLFYDDTDLTGAAPYNRFFWCQVQASGLNEDATSEASIGVATTDSPEICASCKVFYHEAAS